MKHPFSAVVGLFALLLVLGACSARKTYQSALSAYEIGEYYRATEQFRRAYRKDQDPQHRREMAFLSADAYRKTGEYARAAIWYKNAIRRGYPDLKALLHYADCLRATQKFDEAVEVYQQYLDSVPGDVQAINGLDACRYIPEWEKKPSRYIVNPVRELNSKYHDFSPVFVGGRDNEILLTSTREGGTSKRQSSITGALYADLYRSEFQVQRQKWSPPLLIDESGIINTPDEEGAATLTPLGDQMLFTRCRYDRTKDMNAELFLAKMSRGDWSEPILLQLGGDSLMAAHPALSPDGNTLYFVSDRPGGYGQKDIWMAQKEGSNFSRPVNLGDKINTTGNEVFPTVDRDGNLYFSSDHHMGMGGLDVFMASKDEEGLWRVQNLKAPVNSPGDDFGMAFINSEDHRGLFASNRKGSRRDDVYSFYLPPKVFRAAGEIFDKETGQRIDGARIRIIGTDGTNLRMRADGGKFQLKLNPETEYVFAAFRDGYLNDKARETTIGLEDSKDFRVDLYLTPTDAPIRVNNINYEFGSADLTPGSRAALDSLVQLLELNPTITIELMAHTDHVGSDPFNFTLSQQRAQSVVDYLIEQGINPDRLVAKGYGETWPKKVTRELARQHDFLKRNDELTEAFINGLTPEQQEIAKAINRRTEFRVLSTDFQESFAPEPGE
ncbi:OmpA family protein [Gaoshiqia sediminis]|uniref:OmpA family protein n=1 Tax=Gaoshiqia sediminis TaxID=2986998 RepID=A0AA41Y933_9BACT|nr:OmpA family protein [Gaoshiqia sediminis]MCW0483208.1 OmpA family protein [Gaoshiqia sediminis]